MTVTVEVMKNETLNLLHNLENLGLIHVQPSVSPPNGQKAAQKEERSFSRFRGIHAGIPGGSVEDFLARCREDKERELAIEKRREEERARFAKAKLSS